MTQPPPLPPPPPGPGGGSGGLPGRRFSGAWIWIGIGLDLAWILAGAFVTGLVARFGGPSALVALVLGVAPLAGGIALASRRGTPQRRGLGLGLAIGWAVWLIVAAGLCVALYAALTSGGNA